MSRRTKFARIIRIGFGAVLFGVLFVSFQQCSPAFQSLSETNLSSVDADKGDSDSLASGDHEIDEAVVETPSNSNGIGNSNSGNQNNGNQNSGNGNNSGGGGGGNAGGGGSMPGTGSGGSTVDPSGVKTLACVQDGKRVRISGKNKLPSGCEYFGAFIIDQSNTSIDCQGSTLWGVAPSARAATNSMTGLSFNEALAAKTISALNYGIDVVSSSAPISNIEIRNCKLRAFQQGARVHHEKSGSRWLWEYAANDSKLKGPLANYVAKNDEASKTALLNALSSYPWASSSLAGQIRAVAPRAVTFTGVTVDLTSKSGMYVDHHVSDVTISNSSINRARGAGIYLDMGSRANRITNTTIKNTGRESIAIDSSSGNIVQNSTFSNSEWGGVYLYRNCWEHFKDPGVIGKDERTNFFPRTQGSDNNRIIQNEFTGNDGKTTRDVGVWIASRQSMAIDFDGHGCGLFRMASGTGGKAYYQDQAKNTEVTGNTFKNLRDGVIIEDDDAKVFGNTFESSVSLPLSLGTSIRTQVTGAPVQGARISYNVIYQNADTVPLTSVLEKTSLMESNANYRLSNRVCSLFGRANRSVDEFTSSCTADYLKVMKDSGYYKYFETAVTSRIK